MFPVSGCAKWIAAAAGLSAVVLTLGQGCPPSVVGEAMISAPGVTVDADYLVAVGENGSAAAVVYSATGAVGYQWEIAAPGTIVGASDDALVSFTSTAPGTATLVVTVTDLTTGAVGTAVAEIEFRGPALPLTAEAGPDQSVQVGNTVLLTGSAAGGTTVAFSSAPYVFDWRQVSGPAQDISPQFYNGSLAITVIGTTPGTAVFKLFVTDTSGTTATDTVTLTITPAPS